RFESHLFRIERAGSAKYSTPRLASVSGEEDARRAMPTNFEPLSGGCEEQGSMSPWSGTVGKRRDVGLVAIARLARCPQHIRLYFACQVSWKIAPLTHALT